VFDWLWGKGSGSREELGEGSPAERPLTRAWRLLLYLTLNGVPFAEAVRLAAEQTGDELFRSVASRAETEVPALVEALGAGSSPLVRKFLSWAEESGSLSWSEEALVALVEPRPDRVWPLSAFLELVHVGQDLSEAAQLVRDSLEQLDALSEQMSGDLFRLIRDGPRLGTHSDPGALRDALSAASHLIPAPLPRIVVSFRKEGDWKVIRDLLGELRSGRLQLPPVDAPRPARAVETMFKLLGRALGGGAPLGTVLDELGPWVGGDLRAWAAEAAELDREGSCVAPAMHGRPDLFSPPLVRLVEQHESKGAFGPACLEIARRLARGELGAR
jgi:hypothetical protein